MVEFEEFKIDQPETQPLPGSISEINVDLKTPREEIDGRNYSCKEPPAPSKGSSKAKVFAFPVPKSSTKDTTYHSSSL